MLVFKSLPADMGAMYHKVHLLLKKKVFNDNARDEQNYFVQVRENKGKSWQKEEEEGWLRRSI